MEQSTDPAALDAVRVIYESSFPPEERADFDGVADAVRAGARRLFVARDGDGAVAGFGVTRSMEPAGAHLLEYLAVAEGRRDGGLGGNLLDFTEFFGRQSHVHERNRIPGACLDH